MPKLHDMREPEWMRALRIEVEKHGLAKTAALIGRSRSAISAVLNGTYKADTRLFAERVCGALMNKRIDCPVLGEIPPGACQDWQEKPFAATNPERVAVYRACRNGCRHFRRQ